MFYEMIITIVLRGIPESFIYIYGMYAFSERTLEWPKQILSSLILSIIMVLIRTLPISYGIHTILIMMAIILTAIAINKFDMVYCISIAIIIMIIQFLSEGINIVLIKEVFKKDIAEAMSNPISKAIYGIPSLVIGLVGIIFVSRLWKKKRIKNV